MLKIPFTVESYEKDGLLCTDLLIFDIFDSHSWENPAMYQASWKLVTKWPRNPPSGNSLHVSSILPHVFTCFNFCFPSFFGYFPCLPWCFSLFFILGLTVLYVISLLGHWCLYFIILILINVFSSLCLVQTVQYMAVSFGEQLQE